MTREYIRIMSKKIDKSILLTNGAFVYNLRKKILVLHILLLIIITIYYLFIIIITMPNTNLSHDATAAGSIHIT